MEKLLNFRKLADGMKNVEGKEIKNIYRSADSSLASKSDIDYLVENNIIDIIDLRSPMEIEKHPTISDERVKRVHINIIDHGKQNEMAKFSIDTMQNIMVELYRDEFVDTDGYTEEMAYILGLKGSPFMFHCTAGKDRTGTTGAILMHVLGFTKEQIIEEYLKIDELLIKHIREQNKKTFNELKIELTEDAMKIVEDLSGVRKEFIDAYLNRIDEVYGTFDKYVETKLKLTSADIEKLKEYYLV